MPWINSDPASIAAETVALSALTAAAATSSTAGTKWIAAPGTIKTRYWNGSAWVLFTRLPKVWNGSAWVPRAPSYWNGSAWIS